PPPRAAGRARGGRHLLGGSAHVVDGRRLVGHARRRAAPRPQAVRGLPRALLVHDAADRGARRPRAPRPGPRVHRHDRPDHVRLRLPPLGLRLAGHDPAALRPQGAQGQDHGRQRLPSVRLRLMTAPPTEGAIDVDVHVAPASIDALTPHMDDYWRDYLANAGLVLSPHVGGSYPPGAPRPPGDLGALREQVLDPWRLSHAVLTCLTAFDASRNGYYEAALCSAINDWLRAEWLERDERLRAYLTIPTLDPDA